MAKVASVSRLHSGVGAPVRAATNAAARKTPEAMAMTMGRWRSMAAEAWGCRRSTSSNSVIYVGTEEGVIYSLDYPILP